MSKGIIIGGEYKGLIARKKSSEDSEIGELLVSETNDKKHILQVYNLSYGSQLSQQNLELVSGMQ